MKWWRGDKTPDSLERPPRESGDDSEAQQAEQAAKDATQDPSAGISNTSARQTPPGQSSTASPSNASTLGQTAAGQSQRAGTKSGPASSGPDSIGSASHKTQDQSSGGWLSWLTGGRSSSSQQVSQALLCTVSCAAGLGHGSHMSVCSHQGCQARGRQARRHGERWRATASGRAASKPS